MTDVELVPHVEIAFAAVLNIDDAWTVVRKAASEHFASGAELPRKVYKRASAEGSLDNHDVL
jgi:hypothetical protein